MPRPTKPNPQLPDSTRRLHDFLEERRIQRKEFAVAIGITPSGVSSIFQHGRPITALQAAAIETRYGIKEKWLLEGEGPRFRDRHEGLRLEEQWLLQSALPDFRPSHVTLVEIPRMLAHQYFFENLQTFRMRLMRKPKPDEALVQHVVDWQSYIAPKFDNAMAALEEKLPVKIGEKELSDQNRGDYASAQLRQWQTARYYFMDLTTQEEEIRPSNQAEEFGHDIDRDWINHQRELFLVEWKKLLSMVIDNLRKPENKLS